ncbi:biotin-dependent carboxyltransferase family protein [Streptomyces sp. H10-C2]|uniref:5-oxoprolinase subunit C family protein n=1 Tax=unclassified Streptomyces TaxID=2593676 RepID=UPI0024B8BAB7|nr:MULTISPECIES: biotin-dependent carboxyltransferase family protein [unclassified Streptomyces]MDJ0346080.1 biotin-dependent carboxyltransferase family protein [Streptomyces sp. PH10-H1]MDJ0373056.1 biotin-dependent carboxyltransferase family protein [Streptomyces sp. H10-C2]
MTRPADPTGPERGPADPAGPQRGRVEVVRAGALTTVQDLGRPGHAHLGVPRSGALDMPAHRRANRLVGNPDEAATLETTVNGCAVRADRPVVAAVTGAPCAVTVDGRPAPWGAPVRVPAGAVLELGAAQGGLRCYLALAGGIDVEPVLGSRSADLLSGLGPAPLSAHDTLPLGAPHGPAFDADTMPWPAPPAELVLSVLLGPRDGWFTDDAPRLLATGPYTVSAASNRIGLRTEGPALRRAVDGELPSEGMVLGAVQVPPDGRPVIFLADHPTTGGYPVIGVVPEPQLAAAAQAVPGTPVRFLPVRGNGGG